MSKNTEIKFIRQPNLWDNLQEVLLIDSTTIRLFSDILKGVGRNPKGDGKKKGGLKVHMLIDAVQSVGRFIKITAAKAHDQKFLKSLDLISMLVVSDLLRSTNRGYQIARGSPDGTMKLALFAKETGGGRFEK